MRKEMMRYVMFNSWTLGHTGPLKELTAEYTHLEQLNAALEQVRPRPEASLKSLRKDFALRYTYHSNAIEGNTLTLQETMVILKDGFTIGGKSMKEHLEVVNHQDAIEYLAELARSPVPIDEQVVKELHRLVLRGIDKLRAGQWRFENIRILDSSHLPPRAEHIQDRMNEFFHWLANEAQKLPVIERAARIHADFVNIHPFVDANGRTARLLMNLELIKSDYPLAIVEVEHRQAYYQNLDHVATDGDYLPFAIQVCGLVEKSFMVYAAILGYNWSREADFKV